ncbi:MAG: M50 family metallopeptidase, partial [Proteobacteria bacterium]|nr:M50 family metallopeptidase [Pseudomonadota bacterium]
QFLAFLQKLSLASIDKPIVFNLVVREEKPELASTVFGPERSLQVSVEKDWRFDPLTLIESLGVNHSQLTIFKSEEPAGTLQKGDMLIAWDGKPVSSAFEFSQLVSDNRQPSAVLSLLRKGQLEKFTVNLKAHELQKAEGRVTIYALPVSFWGGLEEAELVEERYTNPLKAVWFGLHETIATTQGISRGIFGLLTGELPLAAIGGPIAIAKVASDSVQLGWQIFFQSLAIISINLALINLIPIPVLDGGQLVLLAAEAALRRPVPEVAVENYQKLGFMMVLALVVIATYNDLGRFWASMLKGVGSMF